MARVWRCHPWCPRALSLHMSTACLYHTREGCCLLVRLQVKNSNTPEIQRNATRRTLNSDMQKLLGDEVYQKYRKVRVANTAKAKVSGSGGTAPGSTHARPAAPVRSSGKSAGGSPGGKKGGKKKGAAGTSGAAAKAAGAGRQLHGQLGENEEMTSLPATDASVISLEAGVFL